MFIRLSFAENTQQQQNTSTDIVLSRLEAGKPRQVGSNIFVQWMCPTGSVPPETALPVPSSSFGGDEMHRAPTLSKLTGTPLTTCPDLEAHQLSQFSTCGKYAGQKAKRNEDCGKQSPTYYNIEQPTRWTSLSTETCSMAPTASQPTDCRTKPTIEREDFTAKTSCQLFTSRPRYTPRVRVEVLPDGCDQRHPWWLRQASQCWHWWFLQGQYQGIGAVPHKLRRHTSFVATRAHF